MLFLQASKDIQWFPTSVGAGLALVLSLISLAAIFVGYGRWIEKLNGVGGRVKELELEAEGARAEREQFRIDIRTIVEQNARMLQELGRHERGTEACREDTEKLGIDLGFKISELVGEFHVMDNNLSNRLTRVETKLETRQA